MGVTYHLFRLERGTPFSALSVENLQGIPFGPLGELTAQLAATPSFRVLEEKDPEAYLSFFPPERREEMERLRSMLPASRSISYLGREHPIYYDLLGDPVMHITIEKRPPEDLLPVIQALRDLEPFVIFESYGRILDPESLRDDPDPE